MASSHGDDFTVFAPVNFAFSSIPSTLAEDVEGDLALLTNVLKYHAVGKKVFSEDLVCTETVRMVNGDFTRTKCMNDGIYQVGSGNNKNIGLPEVIDVDIEACNGVVHIVNNVILPGR